MNVLKDFQGTQSTFIVSNAARPVIHLKIALRKVSLNHSQINFIEKQLKKAEEEISPEEELHNFLQDLKKDKDQRVQYKMITGKEAPSTLNFNQFQAE